MKRRIVFFHLLNNFTGSPLVLKNVILVALAEGYEIVLYTSRSEGFLSDLEGVKTKNNFYFRSRFRFITLFSFFISQFLVALRVIFEEFNKKSIFYINTILPFTGVLLGRFLRRPVIQHVHEFSVSPAMLNSLLFYICRKYASTVVVVSEALSTNKFLEGRKPNTIYNSVSENFVQVVSETKKSISHFRITMLASLRPYKGIDEFIILARDLPEFQFTLVLSDESKEVDRYFDQKSVPENISILSVQKDVHSIYQKTSLIINLTHTDKCLETFGLTVLEGMHYGIPAIGPTKGGVAELIIDGINGYKIDYTDFNKLKETIRWIGTDTEKYEQLSQGALKIKDKFGTDKFHTSIKRLLNVH